MQHIVSINPSGTITLPLPVLEELGLHGGEQFIVSVTEGGELRLRPPHDLFHALVAQGTEEIEAGKMVVTKERLEALTKRAINRHALGEQPAEHVKPFA
jgi:bifunctional DNA-binding transcriptional regulator/antitoxin component of YhaV-PrlF toxin-antitoxin module